MERPDYGGDSGADGIAPMQAVAAACAGRTVPVRKPCELMDADAALIREHLRKNALL
jgi:hypothetical protein